MLIDFIVPGVPVGKGRPRFKRVGNHVRTYTPAETASYENLVALAASSKMVGKQLMTGAIAMELFIEVPIPASWSKKKQAKASEGTIHPTTKPDLDNIFKLVADALNNIVYVDDKQVVRLTAAKIYSETPRVAVRVCEINGGSSSDW